MAVWSSFLGTIHVPHFNNIGLEYFLSWQKAAMLRLRFVTEGRILNQSLLIWGTCLLPQGSSDSHPTGFVWFPRQLRQPSITLWYPYKTHTTPEPSLAIHKGLGPHLSLSFVAFCHKRKDSEPKLLVWGTYSVPKSAQTAIHHPLISLQDYYYICITNTFATFRQLITRSFLEMISFLKNFINVDRQIVRKTLYACTYFISRICFLKAVCIR